MVRLQELEAWRDKLAERPSLALAGLQEIQANMADICRSGLARLAVTPALTENRDTATLVMSDPTKRIVLAPRAKRFEMAAVQCVDLHTILEWAGNGCQCTGIGTSLPGMPVVVVAWGRNH